MPEKNSTLGDQWIEILKTGTFTDSSGKKITFTEEDLRTIAERHGPDHYEAPLVLGHPKTDEPAYGWVDRLKVSGGRLLAKFRDVADAFATAFKEGRFRKKSVRVLRDERGWFLGHVGFLGAAMPAVPGLADGRTEFAPQFDGGASYPFEVQTSADFEFGGDGDPEAVPTESENEMTPEQQKAVDEAAKAAAEKTAAEFQKQLAAKDAQLADFQKQIADQKARDLEAARARSREEAKDFAESLVKAGQILPKLQPKLIELVAGISDTETVEFSVEGSDAKKTMSRRALLKEFLREALAKGGKGGADFSERASAKDDPAPDGGEPADKDGAFDQAKIHKAAVEFARKNKVSYDEALNTVIEQG